MSFSHRISRLKLAGTVTFVVLVLIYLLPSYTWPITDDETVLIPAESSPVSEVAPQVIKPAIAIPEKIWYKLGTRNLTEQAQGWIDSCVTKNPTFTYEFMTDTTGDEYVKKNFAHRQDIVEAFLALSFPILKADFLRYMLLFKEGGIYCDLDVSCNDVPISDWIPAQYKNNASLVVGWEFDVGWGDSFVREFATWTIMARPGSPHLLMVLDDILEGLREKTTQYNVTIADLTWAMVGEVVDLTGPRRMTRSILKSLKNTVGESFDEKSIAAIYEPKLIGDVLVLPGYSFSLSSNHYKPEDRQGPALVTHHFDGSWKNDHGGETVDAVP